MPARRRSGLRGAIGGTVTFAGDPARWLNGNAKLTIDGGPGVISGVTVLGQTLPDVPFEHLVARMDLDKGVLRIEEAAISGTDLAASVDGRIRLRTPLPQSFVDLNCKVRLPPAVMVALQGLSDLASTYKQKDGSYQLQVKGTFTRPRLR